MHDNFSCCARNVLHVILEFYLTELIIMVEKVRIGLSYMCGLGKPQPIYVHGNRWKYKYGILIKL